MEYLISLTDEQKEKFDQVMKDASFQVLLEPAKVNIDALHKLSFAVKRLSKEYNKALKSERIEKKYKS